MSDVEKMVAEMKRTAAKASPGPWRNDAGYRIWFHDPEDATGIDSILCDFKHCDGIGNDGEYIAAAQPSNVISLIAEYERLKGVVDKLSKDALGNIVIPGQHLYTLYGAEWEVSSTDRAHEIGSFDNDPSAPTTELYPTKGAAKAALLASAEKGDPNG